MLDITTKIMNANGRHTSRSTMKLLAAQLAKIDFNEMHQQFKDMVYDQNAKGSQMYIHSFAEKRGMPLFGSWRTWGHVCLLYAGWW
jgi:hypothetical protein